MTSSPFAEFNRYVAQIEVDDVGGETPPALFICGPPRSGTTIFAQAITYVADVGYINNLIARFATNPAQ